MNAAMEKVLFGLPWWVWIALLIVLVLIALVRVTTRSPEVPS